MRLSDHLAALSDDELVELFRQRPDLHERLPDSLGQLAGRVGSANSLARAMLRADLGMCLVAEAVVALDSTDLDRLVDILSQNTDRTGVVEAIERLRVRAIVTVADDQVRPVGQLADLYRYPLGLGRPFAVLTQRKRKTDLLDMASLLGVEVGAECTKAEITDRLLDHLGSPDEVRALLDAAPPRAREIVRRLSGLGQPSAYRSDLVHAGTPPEILDWLEQRGLIAGMHIDRVELPHEVALAMRQGLLPQGISLTPPQCETSPGLAQPHVDAECFHAASRVVDACGGVLAVAADGGIATLKAGGVGVREVKRVATAVGLDPPAAGRLLEIMFSAHLLTRSYRDEGVAPTPQAAEWLERPRWRRWLALVNGWLNHPTFPSLAGTRDEHGKPIPALSHQWVPFHGGIARPKLLEALDAVDDGRAPLRPSLSDVLTWHDPNIWMAMHGDVETTVEWVLDEAQLMGLVDGAGAPSSIARHLARGDLVAMETAACQAMPSDETAFVIQPDLTAVAFGALAPAVERQLRVLADAETADRAVTYRFSEATIRRAFDEGWTTDEIGAFLESHALQGVPQPLTYLIDDVERRYGNVRVVTAKSLVVSDDEVLIAEIAGHRRAGKLRLRQVAPTVLVSTVSAGELMDALRGAGYFPVRERGDGEIVIERANTEVLSRAPGETTSAVPGPGEPAPGTEIDSYGLADWRPSLPRELEAEIRSSILDWRITHQADDGPSAAERRQHLRSVIDDPDELDLYTEASRLEQSLVMATLLDENDELATAAFWLDRVDVTGLFVTPLTDDGPTLDFVPLDSLIDIWSMGE